MHIFVAGPTYKHLYVIVDDIYEELQNENGPLAQQWAGESIRARTRELAEDAPMYQMGDRALRAHNHTRFSTDPSGRGSKTSKYCARHLSPTCAVLIGSLTRGADLPMG